MPEQDSYSYSMSSGMFRSVKVNVMDQGCSPLSISYALIHTKVVSSPVWGSPNTIFFFLEIL